MSPDASGPSTVYDLAFLGRAFHEHRARLLAMLDRRIDPALVPRIDPEEVLQETYLLARRRWEHFARGRSVSVYSWLYRLALDSLIEAWRRETRASCDLRQELPWPEQSSLALGLGLVSPATSPSQAVQREELRQQVRRLVDLLPAHDREILGIRYFDGLSFAEAAEVLGLTENAAKVRHVRALRRLQAAWRKVNPAEEGGP